MEKIVRNTIEKYQMFQNGDMVILGVSGGKDSVCLLCVLHNLRQEYGIRLHVVHVHHGIRGAEADRDAEFTVKLCDSMGIPCKVVYCEVPKLAKTFSMTLEEAGRTARYRAFEEEAERIQAACIAVAHHKNDQAETVLLHLFRGTSVNGLKGIRPVSGRLVRPLLFCSPKEIEAYLAKKRQPYCQDLSNLENNYTRNFLRNCLIPDIEGKINPNLQNVLCNLAEDAADVAEYLGAQCDEAERRVLKWEEKRVYYHVDAFLKEAPVIRRELIMRGIAALAGARKDLGRVHVSAVSELFFGQTGRQICLSYGIHAWKSYGEVVLSYENPFASKTSDGGSPKYSGQFSDKDSDKYGEVSNQSEREPAKTHEGAIAVNVPGTYQIFLAAGAYKCSFLLWGREDWERHWRQEQSGQQHEKKILAENGNYGCTKCFDYDRIDNMLVLRHRLPGDYLLIDVQGHRQKLKDYFINEKIPKELRDKIWVLASGSEIIWILGYRESPGYFVREDTKNVLVVLGGHVLKPESALPPPQAGGR